MLLSGYGILAQPPEYAQVEVPKTGEKRSVCTYHFRTVDEHGVPSEGPIYELAICGRRAEDEDVRNAEPGAKISFTGWPSTSNNLRITVDETGAITLPDTWDASKLPVQQLHDLARAGTAISSSTEQEKPTPLPEEAEQAPDENLEIPSDISIAEADFAMLDDPTYEPEAVDADSVATLVSFTDKGALFEGEDGQQYFQSGPTAQMIDIGSTELIEELEKIV